MMTNQPNKPPLNLNKPPTVAEQRLGRQTLLEATRSQSKKTLAKGRLDAAFRLKIDGDNAGALATLSDAVRTDPELVSNSAAVGLAQALTDLPRDQAVLSLLETSVDDRPILSSRPKIRVTVASLLLIFEIGLLLIVLAVFCGLERQGMVSALSLIIARSNLAREIINPLRVSLNGLQHADVSATALKSGGMLTIVVLLAITGIYFLGTLLGGVGTLAELVRWSVRVYLLTFIVLIGALFVLLAGLTALEANQAAASALIFSGTSGILITGTMALILLSRVVVRVHAIGFLKGLATVLVGNALALTLATVVGLFA